jgi:hypothetical protein
MRVIEVTSIPSHGSILDLDSATWALQRLIRGSNGAITKSKKNIFDSELKNLDHAILVIQLTNPKDDIDWLLSRIKWCRHALSKLQVISETSKHTHFNRERSTIFEQLMNEFSEMQRKHYGRN